MKITITIIKSKKNRVEKLITKYKVRVQERGDQLKFVSY